ncbi:MAG: helix-turn-helix domain-containing protein [Acidobacteriota bacterium]|nr:helix-turn-helix domain-containing protein [Blastocatellia bacterium]MDW8413135.1 helix-turn-helix domain-containing protein [Acidobacteriota bacterium]
METLGQELKRRREEQNITLQEISEATRIGIRFLRAIESDDYAALPGGVYSRSFIKAYARYVKMNEEEAIEKYRKATNTTGDELLKDFSSTTHAQHEPSQLLVLATVVVLLGLIAAVGWLVVKYFAKEDSNLPQVQAVAQPPQQQDTSKEPTKEELPTTTTAAVAEGLTLVLKATKDCWVSVQSEDAKPVELIIPSGQTKEFKATSKFLITVGNLTAVRIELNGQQITLPSKDGLTAKRVLITKDNFKDFLTTTVATSESETSQPAAVQQQPSNIPETATKPQITKPPVIAGSLEDEIKPETKPTTTKPRPSQDQPQPDGSSQED